MKHKKSISGILALAFLFLILGAGAIQAQPSDAQLKKVLTGPKTVSVTLNGPGKVEWDSAYKKYIWTRYFTAKLKTDTVGEFLIVKGYAAYDVMGGRYVYWRTFTSGNNYEGKKNPPVAEINEALGKLDMREFARSGRNIIGEYESFRIAPDTDWEWHTPDSVSFNVVAVYHVIYNGQHYEDKDAPYQYQPGFKAVDKVESLMRLRLYRKGANTPWDNIGVSDRIRDPQDRRYLKQSVKLLERKVYPAAEVEQMPRMSKVPRLEN